MAALAGRAAVVTGASSGIGAGLAAMLADEGARVVLAARRGKELERVATEIREAPQPLRFPQLQDELKGYATSSGALRIGIDEPLPVPLVEKLIAVRLQQALSCLTDRAQPPVPESASRRRRLPLMHQITHVCASRHIVTTSSACRP